MSGNQPAREACYFTRGEQDMLMKALQYYAQEQQKMISAEWEKQIGPYHAKGKKAPAKNEAIFQDHHQHHSKIMKAADNLHERFRTGDHRKGENMDENDNRPIFVRSTTARDVGSCNACTDYERDGRQQKVKEVQLRGMSFRLCGKCERAVIAALKGA